MKIIMAALICTTVFIGACKQSETSSPTPGAVDAMNSAEVPAATSLINLKRVVAADSEPQNWLAHGRTFAEERFSPLEQIDTGNVSQLKLAWYHRFDTDRGQEATPLVVDGILYVTSAWSKVYAFDAKNGSLLWEYNPQVPAETAIHACCDVVNRGAAIWNDMLYVGTLDGRLIALDAASGKLRWEVMTVDADLPYTITGAPRIADGKVIIGNGGAEYGVRGYVSAYDAKTGAQRWRFYTVPGNPADGFDSNTMKKAAATWTGEWWKYGGGGTVWDSMAYDPELNLLYIGVGNGAPWNASIRSPEGGDNLYLSSIVALNPQDGSYVWHYQTTPGDSWDYTATQHMILTDLTIAGVERKVIMQAPKNGFFYVLDRSTGELISAEPYVPVNWAKEIDKESGRPVEVAAARYGDTGEMWLSQPGAFGGHNWQPMSFSPETGLVYIPAQELPFPFFPVKTEDFTRSSIAYNLGVDLSKSAMPQQPASKAEVMTMFKGRLIAWDPVAQKPAWRVEYSEAGNGGVLSTAGNLVFQGDSLGNLNAYNAASGEHLWRYTVQTGIVAPPITFAIDGQQYIGVMAGWGGGVPLVTGEIVNKSFSKRNISRLLVFSLQGNKQLPPVKDSRPPTQRFAAPKLSAEQVAEGKANYQRFCSGCHGDAAVSGGVLPDLRVSPMIQQQAAFNAVVLDGVLSQRGMISFASELEASAVDAIRAYLLTRNNESFPAVPN